jgi:hypothetical protein
MVKIPTDWQITRDSRVPPDVLEEHLSGGEQSAFERVMAPDRATAGIECGIGGRFADGRRGDRELRLENHPETGSSKLHLHGRLGFARHSRNFGCYGRSGAGPVHCRPRSQFPIEIGA